MEDLETRGSALPRPSTISKLPQIRPSRASTLIEPGTLAASRTNGTSIANKRSSVILPPGFNTSPRKPAAPFSPPRSYNVSAIKPVSRIASPSDFEEAEQSIDAIMGSPTKQRERASSSEEETGIRKPRPSLSDRAMESLSTIPPSPSPAKRRQSGFFASESPMGPPSRTTSALAYSRPSSQLSFGSAAGRTKEPISPSKRAITAHGRTQSTVIHKANGTSLESRRAVSGSSGLKSPRSIQAPQAMSRLTKPEVGMVKSNTTNRMSMIGSKTVNGRPSGTRSPVKDTFGAPLNKPTAKPGLIKPPSSVYRRQTGTAQPKTGFLRNVKSPVSEPEQSADELMDRKIAYSSQTLRNTIQQARQRMDKQPGNAFMPRAIAEDDLSAFGIDVDPRSMDLQDSTHVNIIRKRINMAKSDGKLNISMLCLTELPREVLTMYDTGSDDGGPAWYEAVDIVRLNAADNELAELPENIFATPTSADEESFERDASTGIFAGLEGIDLHANHLVSLPSSIGTLTRITSLNLSRNQLQCTAIDIISAAISLKELRLSQNHLKGLLPLSIGNLAQLEILDLHGNALIELPATLGNLSSLKQLDVSDNQLSGLPMSAIFDLPLVEINASRNRISDTLIPANVPLVPYLQKLNICTNALSSLSDSKIDFPSLQSLDISNNKISALPNLSGWQKLTFLNVEENKISEIPAGFSSLKELSHADFGNNSLLELDESIGNMEKLSTFNLANNPIRERRLPKLTTEELKSELKARVTGLTSPGSDKSGLTPQFSTFAQAMAWTVTGDTLDKANSKLKTVEKMDLEPIVHENVRQCILHHNQLQTIPQSLELLGSTLTSLDLSNNKLSKEKSFLPQPLALPNLQILNLTLNGLSTLDPLAQNLKAPKLATLIVTFNKVTYLPMNPSLTSSFPSLTKLVATNNKIVSLDVNALRGLQVLDVSSNEIEALPAQLALLEGTLRTLMVNGNKFRVPSWGVLEKGTEEVLKWCRRQIPKGEEGAMEAEW